jgi:hypothetical protein
MGVEITLARGSKEGVNNLSLASEIGAMNRGRSLYPAACPARKSRADLRAFYVAEQTAAFGRHARISRPNALRRCPTTTKPPAAAADPATSLVPIGVFEDNTIDRLSFRRGPEVRAFEKAAFLADDAVSVLRSPLLQ